MALPAAFWGSVFIREAAGHAKHQGTAGNSWLRSVLRLFFRSASEKGNIGHKFLVNRCKPR